MGNILTAPTKKQGQPYGYTNADNATVQIKSISNITADLTAVHTVNTTNTLKILGLNVCGLQLRLDNCLLQRYVENHDVLCISETKLDKIDELNISIPNFTPVYHHRKEYTRKSGGLAIFVRSKHFNHITELKYSQAECVQWIKISKKLLGYDLVIGNIYVPPKNTEYFTGNELDHILDDVISINAEYKCEICIVGDWNAKTACEKDYTTIDSIIANLTGLDESDDTFISESQLSKLNIEPQRSNLDKRIDKAGHHFLDLCKSSGLLIVNGRAGQDRSVGMTTCEKGSPHSTIDYVIASPTVFPKINDFYVDIFDQLLSDYHCPIHLYLNYEKRPTPPICHTPAIPPRNSQDNSNMIKNSWENDKKYIFKNAFDVNQMNSIITELQAQQNEPVTQEYMESITEKIHNIYKEAGCGSGVMTVFNSFNRGKLRKQSPSQPWFNKKCAINRKDVMKAKHKFRKIKSDGNKTNLICKSKAYNNAIKIAKREFETELHKKLRNLRSSCPKEYWAILNKTIAGSEKLTSLTTQCLLEHFKKLSQMQTSEEGKYQSNMNVLEDDNAETINNLAFNLPFSEDEIGKQLPKLKNGKSCGIDNILNEFIKYSPPEMTSLLTYYFNLILNSGIIPSDWTLGIIIPIFKKKGSIDDPDNYRGITLLSCIGKFFTLLINTRLNTFLDINNLLGEEQAGFRAQYSTLDHIFTLHCIIDLYISKGKKLYCAFIDYRKAFDMIDRYSLWQKLLSTGIKGKVFRVIQNMYSEAKSCIRNKGEMSDFFSCNIGVRQGENLSPLLFSIFLNDLEQFLAADSKGINLEYTIEHLGCYIKLYSLLYADDTILLSESPEDLQKMLNALHKYCEKWKLQVNSNKTKVVIFSKGTLRKTPPEWLLGGEKLEVVKDYTYLGITFNFNGSFKKAIKKQIVQAKRASYSLIAKTRRLKLPLDIQLHLFDACVIPILLYGSEVWGFSNLQDIELFHHQFCKYILKIGKKSINSIALGELGRHRLEKTVKLKMLNFWTRLITGKKEKIALALYHKLKNLYDTDEYRSPWISHIKIILDDIDQSQLWNEPSENINPLALKSLFDSQLSLNYSQDWLDQIQVSSACSTYSIIKENLQPELYLTKLESKFATSLCKFRCLNHWLPVVAGRYKNITRTKRKCDLCLTGDVGDEFHYIFICSYFTAERTNFIDQKYITGTNTQKMKLKHLFNSENEIELQNLAKFTKIIMCHFNETRDTPRRINSGRSKYGV